MRHLKARRKLGRTSQHRDALLANLTASLIKHSRIRTTLAKAKVMRPFAEKLVTLAKSGTLHDRRLAIARIGQIDAVHKLFADIAPKFKDRQGGYTRIVKLGPRYTDSAPEALIEWVDYIPTEAVEAPAKTKEPKAPKAEKADKADEPKAEKKPAKKPSKKKDE